MLMGVVGKYERLSVLFDDFYRLLRPVCRVAASAVCDLPAHVSYVSRAGVFGNCSIVHTSEL